MNLSPVPMIAIFVLASLVVGGVIFSDVRQGGPVQEEEKGVSFQEAVTEEVVLGGPKTEIYDGIFVSNAAEKIDLSGQGLSGSLKAEIRHIRNLRRLDISDNEFTGLPAEIGQLKELEILDVSYNPLTGLPHELGNLPNLKVLDTRGTQAAEFDLDTIGRQLPDDAKIFIDHR